MQIVESFLNEKKQPRQRIVQHLGVAFDDEQLRQLWDMGKKLISELERRAKEEELLQGGRLPLFHFRPEACEREIPEEQTARLRTLQKREDVLEGPFEIWGEVFDRLGIEDVLGLSDRGRGSTNALRLCLCAKLTDGGGKKRSADWLGERMGLAVSEDRFYRMMDKLAPKIDKVKELGFQCGRSLCGNSISLVLFDVTTLYFESFTDDEDEGGGSDEAKKGLRRHGFSKDCKFKETQVVLALATSSEGIPLWYEVFPGNTAECSTLARMMEAVSKKVSPEEIWVVADGAMLTEENRGVLKDAKAGYVLGASLKKLRRPTATCGISRTAFVCRRTTLKFGRCITGRRTASEPTWRSVFWPC